MVRENNSSESQSQNVPEAAKPRFPGLTSDVIRLGLVSFFADVSSEMLYPITPIFLTAVLGAPAAVLGVIEGVAEATASLMRTVAGRMSDRSGQRKPFVFAGYSLSALAKPLIGLAATWPFVLIARIMDRFGKGLRSSPRDALLADSVDPAYRGQAFGWHRAMDTMGAVLGPLFTISLLALLSGDIHSLFSFAPSATIDPKLAHLLRLVFLFAFFPGIIGALLVLTVKEHRKTPPPSAVPPSIGFASLPANFRQYLIAWGIFSAANSSDAFLILRANQLGYSFVIVTLIYIFYNLVYAVSSPWLGHLSDRIGRKQVLIGGLVVFALVYLGFALAHHPWQIWPLFAIYGLYTAATDGVGKAYAVDLVPANIRASALGLLGTVTGLATLVASIAAGALWTFVAPSAAFIFGATGAILGGLVLTNIRPSTVKEHS